MMKMFCFLLGIVFCFSVPLTVYASESDLPEDDSSVVDEGGEESSSYPTPEEIADAVLFALEEQEDEEQEEVVTDEQLALENPAQLAGFDGSTLPSLARGVLDTSAYPYTGGGFISCITSVGNGIVVVAENYKVGTFGFLKGTDRVLNLTSSTVSGYLILSGSTYSARFTSLGQLQYYRQVGSSYQWQDVVINSISDTNVQFLDETGERGIQNPYFTIFQRVVLFFLIAIVSVLLLFVLRRWFDAC